MTKAAPPTSRRRSSPEERRRSLLELGLELFGESSYDQLSTDEIAERAGISRGLLFHYFGNKRGYYVAVIREAADRLLERSRAVRDSGTSSSAKDPQRAQLDAFLGFVEENAGLFGLLMQSGVGVDTEVKAIVDDTRAVLAGRVAPELSGSTAASELDRFALVAWIGAAEAVAVEWAELRRRGAESPDRDRLAELLIQMLPPTMRTAFPDAKESK